MKLSAILEPLVAAGVDAATILLAVKAWEDQQNDALQLRRAADAERQARKRDREKSRDITLRHSDRPLTRDRVAPVEDKPKPIDTDSSKKNRAAAELAAFKGVLAPLDADQLEGLISIRRKKRGSITGYAAKLFVKDAANCKLTLSEAADICIRRNWLTIEPDWLVSNQSRGSPVPKPISASQLALNRAQEGFRNAESPTERDDRPALVLVSQLSERGR